MKKKLFGKLLMGTVLLFAIGSFESCKDYDDDISSLQTQVNTLNGQVTTLQTALDGAKSAASAAQTTADKAVSDAKAAQGTADEAKATAAAADALAKAAATKAEVTALETAISDLKTLMNSKVDQSVYDAKVKEIAGQIDAINPKLNELTKGISDEAIAREAGDKALQEAVSAAKADLQKQIDVLNTFKKSIEDTELPALKKQISDVDAAEKALEERLKKVEGDVAALNTDVSGLKTNMQKAQEDIQKLNTNLQVLTVFVNKMLNSIVLQPSLYYGGIEAVEAQHAMYRPLKYLTDYDGKINGASITYAYDENKPDLTYITPVIDVKYHLNPATVEASQITSLKLLTDDKTYITRTAKAESEVGEGKLRLLDFNNDGKYFEIENGDMHVMLNNSDSAWHKMEPYSDKITVFAIEANAVSSDGTQTRTVTSDYGVLAKVQVSNFMIADNDPDIHHYNTYPYIQDRYNTYCEMMDAQQQNFYPYGNHNWTEDHADIHHLYRTPVLAIENLYTHELAYDGTVDLDKVIEIHALHQFKSTGNQTGTGFNTGKTYDYTIDNLDKYGFERKYTLINYMYHADGTNTNPVGINETGESYYHALIKSDGHTLMAKSYYGTEAEPQVNQNSIGREPLVRVELIDKNNNNALVAVGFIKFRIVGADKKIEPVTIVAGDSVAFCMAKGDTIMTQWDLVENKILGALNMSKVDFERTYALAGNNTTNVVLADLRNQVGTSLGADGRRWANGGIATANQSGSVYVETYEGSGVWVSANEKLNRILHYANGFVDNGRYGEFIWSTDDRDVSETNLLAWKLTAEQMKQLLVKRDHEGRYLNLDGEPVNNIDAASFNHNVSMRVAAKFVDAKNGGNRDVIVIFEATIQQLVATMNRSSVEWYAKNSLNQGTDEIHANIDAYKNGPDGTVWNVFNFNYEFTNALKNQAWLPSNSGRENAFNFDFKSYIKGLDAQKTAYAAAIDASKLQNITPRKLFFFVEDGKRGWVVEGTPYWHNKNTQVKTKGQVITNQSDYAYLPNNFSDEFKANKYMLKVANINAAGGVDTLRYSANNIAYDVKHGDALVAYVFDETTKKFDYNQYEIIAQIQGTNVIYNYNEWSKDLLNVAGYESNTKLNLDKQMTAHLGLKINESGEDNYWYAGRGNNVQVPVLLGKQQYGENDAEYFEAFNIKFIRPLNLLTENTTIAQDADTKNWEKDVKWVDQRKMESNKYVWPKDWRLYKNPATDADWISWYTNNTNETTWNENNYVADLAHMTTDYSGSKDFVEVSMQNIIATGNFSYTPKTPAGTTHFFYTNNNTNVREFVVFVPITLKYAWGELRTLPDGKELKVNLTFQKTEDQGN